MRSNNEAIAAPAARLAGLWKQADTHTRLMEIATGPKTGDELRQAAFEGLTALGGKASSDVFRHILMDAKSSRSAQRLALIALATVDLDAAAQAVGMVLSASPDGDGVSEVFDAFLQRRNGAAILTKALRDAKLPPDVAKVGVRAVRTSGRDAPDLVDALTKAGNLTAGVHKLTAEEMRQMIADVARLGDPARGEAVFRRKDQLCLKCHAIAGAGGQVGPDLSSIGASAQVDYIIESLLEPNKVVKENYHSVSVEMKDGRFFTGIKVRQTETELILRTAEDKELALLRKKIDTTKPGPSLMPDGLTDPLTRAEMLDLVRFLSELGKVGPYSVSTARLVRRWQALTPTPQTAEALKRHGVDAVASSESDFTFEPVYSTVAGSLPLAGLPRLEYRQPFHVVRFQLDASQPGSVRLRLNGAKGLKLWLGTRSVPLSDSLTVDLREGVQTVTVLLDPAERRDGLTVELEDVPGSPARVRVVGGK